MKISMHDKAQIIEKILRTITESHKNKTHDPQKLLIECYTTWFDEKIIPYKENPLYELLAADDRIELKLRHKEDYVKLLGLRFRESYFRSCTDIISSIDKKETPAGYKLINTGASNYYGQVIVDLDEFPVLRDKVIAHNTCIRQSEEYIKQEGKKLTHALETVNTYKQLQSRLPVIFNAMPEETKAKYEAYRDKIKQKRKQKTEPPEELGDFSSLGTTLAIESLKSGQE